MKLYYAPGACSLSSHIALREAGAKFDLEKVDVREKKLADGGDYFAVNPKGYVPALKLDDGKVLTECGVIAQYVADKNPASELAPANGTADRYQMQEWLSFIGSELHKNIPPLFLPGIPEDYRPVALTRVKTRLGFLDGALEGKDYLMGKKFSMADAYAFAILRWLERAKVTLDEWPNVKGYFERVRARPKVQEALKAEGLA